MPDHVCVCIPTYRRPEPLKRLLVALADLVTDGRFTYSVLVTDNDEARSAQPVVDSVAPLMTCPVTYVVAPEKNVAVARNVAVEHAVGSLIAFVDDDEIPTDTWLLRLHSCIQAHSADGALGPVRPRYDREPPGWILRARLFDRPSYPTGTVLAWGMARTGNVLLRRSIFHEAGYRFDARFKHSEDKDFFRRVIDAGYVFVWCDEAPVYETETADRFRRRYHLKRALVRGNAAMRHHGYSKKRIAKSMLAVSVYLAALPLTVLAGQATFMKTLIKMCDHTGGLLAVGGVDLINHFGGV